MAHRRTADRSSGCRTAPPQARGQRGEGPESCGNRWAACIRPHNRGMLRLDPAFPPLWRSATTLQFGADAVAIVDDPAPWQQRLVHELTRGIPDDALEPVAAAFGAPDGAARDFVRRIRRALAAEPQDVAAVVLHVPTGFPAALADAVARSLDSSGLEVTLLPWCDAPGEDVPRTAPVVALAEHVLHPRRAALLMAGDVPHLPVVFTATGAEIGPYVRPGRTACLACVAAHRRDADPAWPLIVSQLIGRPLPRVDAALAGEAGIVAARLVSEGERRERAQSTHSLTLRAGSLHRTARAHRPHAECRCLSLSGSEKAGGPAVLAPTTARAYAQPA